MAYNQHGYGYGYPPPPYNPYSQAPYPPQHYQQYPYGQQGYGHQQPPYQPQHYNTYREPYVPPSKRYKYNSGHHYPQHSYQPPAPPPPPPPPPAYHHASPQQYSAYPQQAYVPPPPTRWSVHASPTPAPAPVTAASASPELNYDTVLQAPSEYSAEMSESPPATFGQEEDHHKKYSHNQHNQASHWQAAHGADIEPGRRFTSLQWTSKEGVKTSKSPSAGFATPNKPRSSTPAPAARTTTPIAIALKPTSATRSVPVKAESVVPTMEHSCEDNNDEWDFDNYFPDEDEQIDERFSIGTVVWRPAQRVKHALSAIWSGADKQDLGAVAPGEQEAVTSVSQYITNTSLNDACRPAKTSKDWQVLRNDPIFADLSRDIRLVSIDQLKKRRHVRADTPPQRQTDFNEEEGELSKDYTILDRPRASLYHHHDTNPLPSPRPSDEDDDEPYSPPPAAAQEALKESMPTNSKDVPRAVPQHPLPTKAQPTPELTPINTPQSQSHLRGGNAPTADPRLAAKKAKGNVQPSLSRSQNQEDILAMLGVTGAPKPVGSRPSPPNKLEVAASKPTTPMPTTSTPMNDPPQPSNAASTQPNKDQEDILAMLGVTGEARPVGSKPGPCYKLQRSPPVASRPGMAEKQQAASTPVVDTPPRVMSANASSARRSPAIFGPPGVTPTSIFLTNLTSTLPPPPPPPPPPPAVDTSKDVNMMGQDQWDDLPTAFDTYDGPFERPSSRMSQHTQAGSDFHDEELEAEHQPEVRPQLSPKHAEPQLTSQTKSMSKSSPQFPPQVKLRAPVSSRSKLREAQQAEPKPKSRMQSSLGPTSQHQGRSTDPRRKPRPAGKSEQGKRPLSQPQAQPQSQLLSIVEAAHPVESPSTPLAEFLQGPEAITTGKSGPDFEPTPAAPHQSEPRAVPQTEPDPKSVDPVQSDDEMKSPEQDINIGRGSLRTRKRSRKQIEADEDADADDEVVQHKPNATSSGPSRNKKPTIVAPTTRKRKS